MALSSSSAIDDDVPALATNTALTVYAPESVAAPVPLVLPVQLLQLPRLSNTAVDVGSVVSTLIEQYRRNIRCPRPYGNINWATPDQALYNMLLLYWLRLFSIQFNAIEHPEAGSIGRAWRFFRQRTLLLYQRVGDAAVRWIDQAVRNEDSAQRLEFALANELAPINTGDVAGEIEQTRLAVSSRDETIRELRSMLGELSTSMNLDESTPMQTIIDGFVAERDALRVEAHTYLIEAMMPPLAVRIVDNSKQRELAAQAEQLQADVAAYQKLLRESRAKAATLGAENETLAARLAECVADSDDTVRRTLLATLADIDGDNPRRTTAALATMLRERMAHLLVSVALPSPLLPAVVPCDTAQLDSLRAQLAAAAAKTTQLETQVKAHGRDTIRLLQTEAALAECKKQLAACTKRSPDTEDLHPQIVALTTRLEQLQRRYTDAIRADGGPVPRMPMDPALLVDAALPSPALLSTARLLGANDRDATIADLQAQLRRARAECEDTLFRRMEEATERNRKLDEEWQQRLASVQTEAAAKLERKLSEQKQAQERQLAQAQAEFEESLRRRLAVQQQEHDRQLDRAQADLDSRASADAARLIDISLPPSSLAASMRLLAAQQAKYKQRELDLLADHAQQFQAQKEAFDRQLASIGAADARHVEVLRAAEQRNADLREMAELRQKRLEELEPALGALRQELAIAQSEKQVVTGWLRDRDATIDGLRVELERQQQLAQAEAAAATNLMRERDELRQQRETAQTEAEATLALVRDAERELDELRQQREIAQTEAEATLALARDAERERDELEQTASRLAAELPALPDPMMLYVLRKATGRSQV